MSFNTIAAEDFEFMLSEFGEDTIRISASGESIPVRGIWESDPPQFDGTSGQKLFRTGSLTVKVDASIPLLETDQWVIHEETWQVDKTQGGIGTAHLGVQVIYLRTNTLLRTRSQTQNLR